LVRFSAALAVQQMCRCIGKSVCCSLQEFVEKLHNESRRFVPILDPGIPPLSGYAPYEDGLKRGVFISDVTGQPYIGEVSNPAICYRCALSKLPSSLLEDAGQLEAVDCAVA
jgi:hypothetical protein